MGGWAEEMLGLIEPRKHKDIDFLFPAEDFFDVEQWAREQSDVREVFGKRFAHKRAYEVADVLVEFTLATDFHTNFFGAYPFVWPSDTFADVGELRRVSIAALEAVRAGYHAHSYSRAIRDGLIATL
ncbi:MAG: hypothetical protein IT406_01150 [Candidatus Yanofskybacteria bacterium]|nr:hypothetical protein [Candidatus Yanofskybacteria bacterium]